MLGVPNEGFCEASVRLVSGEWKRSVSSREVDEKYLESGRSHTSDPEMSKNALYMPSDIFPFPLICT